MLPRFANPHSLSQDAETTTRSEIAERVAVGHTFVDDEHSRSLRRDLDNLLQDTWADALATTLRAKKRQKTADSREREDERLVFRLVSSTKRPQHISLHPNPPPPPVYEPVHPQSASDSLFARTREPDCEDDETQAKVRRIRAQSVAVEFTSLGILTQEISPKHVETKIPLATPRDLPPLLVTEEVRAIKSVKTRRLETGEMPAASPHEPRMSCLVLPVKSSKRMAKTRRRKAAKERVAPAYWRPSPELRGKCMGYGLGYSQ